MLKAITQGVAILGLTASLVACNTPGERAVGGALIGGGGGALVGGALGGRRGALIGAGVGAAGGAVVGAASTPRGGYYERSYGYGQGSGCPYGAYQDAYGDVYCR